MIGFPKIPEMKYRFSYEDSSRADTIPERTGDFSSVSYALGFPIAYQIPKEGGGECISRKMLNRLAYDSSIGCFKSQVGYRETFNETVCEKIGGYPKGAVLKWFKFVREDGKPIPSAAAEKLLGEWPTYSGSTNLESLSVGDVGTYDGNTIVVVSEHDSTAYDETLSDISVKIQFLSVLEVKSVIENNRNDFRANGPTEENGWELIGEVEEGFFPTKFSVGEDGDVLFKRTVSRSVSTDNVVIPANGWLYVECVRDMSGFNPTTLGNIVKAYSDGITGTVTSVFATNPVLTLSRQFGASSRASFMIPVCSGSQVAFSFKNTMGVQMEIIARMFGRG